MGPASRKPPGRRPSAPGADGRCGSAGPTRPDSDREPYGRTALMVCESLILTLVESGVIDRVEALGAVEAVLAVKAGMAPDEDGGQVSARLLRALAASLVAAGPGPLD